MNYLQTHGEVSVKDAQEIWNVSHRTTSTRLNALVHEGLLIEISTNQFDPQKKFRLEK